MKNDAEKLAVEWGVPLAIALLAIGARQLMSSDRLTVFGIARGVFAGLFVGALVNLYLGDMQITEGTRGAIVGICAVLSEDILVLTMRVGKILRDNPQVIIEYLLNRGRKP